MCVTSVRSCARVIQVALCLGRVILLLLASCFFFFVLLFFFFLYYRILLLLLLPPLEPRRCLAVIHLSPSCCWRCIFVWSCCWYCGSSLGPTLSCWCLCLFFLSSEDESPRELGRANITTQATATRRETNLRTPWQHLPDTLPHKHLGRCPQAAPKTSMI